MHCDAVWDSGGGMRWVDDDIWSGDGDRRGYNYAGPDDPRRDVNAAGWPEYARTDGTAGGDRAGGAPKRAGGQCRTGLDGTGRDAPQEERIGFAGWECSMECYGGQPCIRFDERAAGLHQHPVQRVYHLL